MHPGGDVKWEAAVPWKGLSSPTFTYSRCSRYVTDFHGDVAAHLSVVLIGTPTIDEFYAISTRRSRDYLRALPFRRKKPFSQLYPQASEAAVDFLTKTLTFDPKKRLTVEEALAHPYLEAYVRVHTAFILSNWHSRGSRW